MRSSRSARPKTRTEVIKVDPGRPDTKAVAKAARILKRGGLVAFPTETVYGVAARFSDKKAIARLSGVKERPQEKPFTAQIADAGKLADLRCEVSEHTAALAEQLWPGPLTMIMPTRDGKNVGVRIPDNRVALAVLAGCGFPLAVPSANRHGRRPPNDAVSVLKELDGKIDLLLDGGKTDIGVASTVLDMTVFPYRILREGSIGAMEISKAGGGILVE